MFFPPQARDRPKLVAAMKGRESQLVPTNITFESCPRRGGLQSLIDSSDETL